MMPNRMRMTKMRMMDYDTTNDGHVLALAIDAKYTSKAVVVVFVSVLLMRRTL